MGFETISLDNVLIPLIALIVGGVITFWVSRHYYLRAAKGLELEAAKLRHLTTLVLRSMEQAGLAEFNRDDAGEITGMIIKVSAVAHGTSTVSGSLHVKRQHEEPNP